MSHITRIAANAEQAIRNLDALKSAAEMFAGARWLENRADFTAYGNEARGIGNVKHVIGVEGKRYQIGVYENAHLPGTYGLAFDSFSGELEPIFGKGLGKLMMEYHAEVVRATADSMGHMYSRTELPDGSLRIETTVPAGAEALVYQ